MILIKLDCKCILVKMQFFAKPLCNVELNQSIGSNSHGRNVITT